MKLRGLGFDQCFEAHGTQFSQEGCGFARISAVDRGSYLIKNESREVPAELSGKLSYQIESSIDLPCVGDWVAVRYHNDDAVAVIHRVFPRKTFLGRKTVGETVDFQMIAANIDTAFIVQSWTELSDDSSNRPKTNEGLKYEHRTRKSHIIRYHMDLTRNKSA